MPFIHPFLAILYSFMVIGNRSMLKIAVSVSVK